jgi:hypothetical protein
MAEYQEAKKESCQIMRRLSVVLVLGWRCGTETEGTPGRALDMVCAWKIRHVERHHFNVNHETGPLFPVV